MFLCDGGRLIEPFEAPEEDVLARAVQAADLLTDTGVPVSLALIPTTAQLYADILPDGAPNDDQQAVINSAYAQTALETIDLSSTLTAHSSEYIFYRTDHHWTSLGAYYAANALRSSWGLPEIDKDTLTQETVSKDFCGTLYLWLFWIAPTMKTLLAAPENSVRYPGTKQTGRKRRCQAL